MNDDINKLIECIAILGSNHNILENALYNNKKIMDILYESLSEIKLDKNNKKMNDFCRETYRKTLEEVLGFFVKNPGISITEVIKTLNYAINMLNKCEKINELHTDFNELLDADNRDTRKF